MTHPFDDLPDRGKVPTSKRHLDAWIEQAQSKTGIAVGRLGWLVASSVVIAALQRTTGADGRPCFLLKGGAYLEVRLGLQSRATKDVDTLFRGDFSNFVETLDAALREPWGVIELQRSEITLIEGARRVTKPARFKVKLLVNGQTWRSVDVEVAPDEGMAGRGVDTSPAPSLAHFGLPSARECAGIVLDYQIAQKLHACSDPHQPPESRNDRARDIVDLILLRQAFHPDGVGLPDLRLACVDLFDARCRDAVELGVVPRSWPPLAVGYGHWEPDFKAAAAQVGVECSLADGVVIVNGWIAEIDEA